MNNFYKEIFGNALEPIIEPELNKLIITPHVCNNIRKFGAGFAKAVAKKYPEAKKQYLQGTGQPPDNCQFVPVNESVSHPIIIVNMIAQNGVRGPNNPTPIKYEALIKCMVCIREFILPLTGFNSSIHCCKFGSGLAGGD